MTDETNPEFLQGLADFWRKVNERDCRDRVEITNDVVSAYDVLEALRSKGIGEYNKLFLDKLPMVINKFNQRNGYTVFTPEEVNKKCRRIENIGFYVEEGGYYYCKLYYADGRGRIIGTGIVDNTVKVDACDDETIKNKKVLMKYLSKLAEFAEKNPNLSFRWDNFDPIKPTIVGDDFIGYSISPYHLTDQSPYFTNPGEDYKYYEHNGDFGREVVEQRGKVFLERMPVNLADLDPSISEIVRRVYGLEGMKLVK